MSNLPPPPPEGSEGSAAQFASARDAKAQAKAAKAYRKASRPWFKKKRFWALGLLALIVLISALSQGGGDDAKSKTAADTSSSAPAKAAADKSDDAKADESKKEEAAKEPAMEVTAQELITALDSNALAASKKYKGKDVVLTGKFDSVDASGKYFGLRGDDEFTFQNVQVFIDDKHVDTVSAFEPGQDVKVTGRITDVGELLGYSVDAETVE